MISLANLGDAGVFTPEQQAEVDAYQLAHPSDVGVSRMDATANALLGYQVQTLVPGEFEVFVERYASQLVLAGFALAMYLVGRKAR